MIPNVILTRGDVEVPHKDRLFGLVAMEPVAHLREVIELLAKLLIDLAVGFVAACGDVEVVDRRAILKLGRHMAGVAQHGEILITRIHQRQFRQDRHPVIALLPPRDHMGVARRLERLDRDLVHGAFAFLQAQNIWPVFGQQFQHQRLAQADGVDVPSGEGKGHGGGSGLGVVRHSNAGGAGVPCGNGASLR